MRHLVQIVPELPPATSGVGDYALVLARGLSGRGWQTTFVASREQRDRVLEAHDVLGLPGRDRASALVAAIERTGTDTVLLQYSGYGYARRGAPLWLARALRRWKASGVDRRLVVMFHELWAYGPPWRSSFWLFPLQRALVAALLRLADAHLTSTELYAKRLQRLVPHRSPAAVLPVLSNIGEPVDLPRLDAREPLAVVFGRSAVRSRVYMHIDDFMPTLRTAGIEYILDIGPPIVDALLARSSLPVVRCGYLDPPSVSATMLRARFGLLDYPLNGAAKSGVFAAYAAHGVVPILRSAINGLPDGLAHGLNLIRTDQPTPSNSEWAQKLSTAAHLWYFEHSLERTCTSLAAAVRIAGAENVQSNES